MRIAHFSDLHVLDWDGVGPGRFLNKRLTGWVNIRLKRGHIHRSQYVRAIAREIRARKIDHVIVTGDLTNLALEPEFQLAHAILEDEMGLSADAISIVPGNHDLYTQGALRSRRFTNFFSKYTRCDIDVAVDIGTGHFPYVKLRGPVAIIGLSSAVPRPPLVASGEIGALQLEALAAALDHPEVRKRTPVFVLHHPVHNPPSAMKTYMGGLMDADALCARFADIPRGLLLHGHLHRRIQRIVPTARGAILSVGATSASLHHEDAHKMAGFNTYDVSDDGAIVGLEAHVLDPETSTFHVEKIPEA